MKVVYIHHSGFYVETDQAGLLFDYFEGSLPRIPEDRPLYVFASHRHPDHFSRVIFDLADGTRDVTFILSSDIWKRRVPEELKERVVFMGPDEKREIGAVTVETFRSTDEGVAFWCTLGGKQIYHAGDLNHWYWEGEEEQWNRNMTEAYRKEMEKMAGRTADAAFLPLDPRLEQWFYLGIDGFMKKADARVIFPMHFWKQYDVTEKLRALPCSEDYRDRVMQIREEGQEFLI